MGFADVKPKVGACSGCGVEGVRNTRHGRQCAKCKALLERYTVSQDELNVFLQVWLDKWRHVDVYDDRPLRSYQEPTNERG